jgi:DNA-binding MarR family transcriptional regulator
LVETKGREFVSSGLPKEEVQLDLAGISNELGFLLRIAQLKLYGLFYDEFGSDDVRPGAFSALLLIGANPGVRLGVLGRRLMIKPAHMTKMARQFEDAGWIERSVSDDDRRAVELRLTPSGVEHVAQYKDRFFGHDRERLQEISPEERETLTTLLKKLVGV